MDTDRLNEKVEALGLLPRDVLTAAVTDAALQALRGLLENAASGESVSEEDRRQLVGAVRRAMDLLPMPLDDDAFPEETRSTFVQSLENMLNSTSDEETKEASVLALVDTATSGIHPNPSAVVNVVNGRMLSAPAEQVLRLVDALGGVTLPKLSECREQLYQRCATDVELFNRVTDSASEADIGAWLSTMLPRMPEAVLAAAMRLGLPDGAAETLCLQALEFVANDLSAQRASVVGQVAGLLKPDMAEGLEAFANVLVGMLVSGNASAEADGRRLLREHGTLLSDGLARMVARGAVEWFVDPNLGDKNHQPTIDAIVELQRARNQDALTTEEVSALVGVLFDKSVRDERRADVIRHAMGALRTLGVKYKDRAANFEDVRRKYEQEGDEEVKAAVASGLSGLRPSGLKGLTAAARTFWKWFDTLDDTKGAS